MSRYQDIDSSKEYWQISWYIPTEQRSKRVRLHNKLFGHRERRKGGWKYCDGILVGWKSNKRVKLIDYVVLGQTNLAIPVDIKDLADRIESVFLLLKIDHRSVPYIFKHNYLVRFIKW